MPAASTLGTIPRRQQRHKLLSELLLFVDEPDAQACWPAMLIDVSAAGARFLVHRRHWEPGELAPIQLLSRSSRRRYTTELEVVHAQKVAPHYWVIGGAFRRPLTAEDLADILGPDELEDGEERTHSWWDSPGDVVECK